MALEALRLCSLPRGTGASTQQCLDFLPCTRTITSNNTQWIVFSGLSVPALCHAYQITGTHHGRVLLRKRNVGLFIGYLCDCVLEERGNLLRGCWFFLMEPLLIGHLCVCVCVCVCV